MLWTLALAGIACGDSGRQDSATTPGGTLTATATEPTGTIDDVPTGTSGATQVPTGTGAEGTGTATMGSGPGGNPTSDATSDATSDSITGSATQTDTSNTDTGNPVDCLPPDALILLDRTLTMHKTADGLTPVDAPAYASSKWYQAIAGIEALSAPPLDATVRFGLELWPRDPGGGQCITLAERIENTKVTTNPKCEAGEVVIEPVLNNGAMISSYLDPAKTLLCATTPTGAALSTAAEYLAANKEDNRSQYTILVTDGADWSVTCPDPSPLKSVQDLAKQNVKTYVVGFSGEEAKLGATKFLNDLACAGQTAKGFPGSCVATPDGFVSIGGDIPVYLQADNAQELGVALTSVAGQLCCGCEKTCDPPEVLFALDRTGTMHRTPDGLTPVDGPEYKSSKWSQAITAIEGVAAGGLDQTLRLGLELWPRDPGGGQCITLTERILNTKNFTNPSCEVGEILVPPILGAGPAILSAVDPLTTNICTTTPTGAGLITASDWLTDNIVPGRKQYIVLVTDGTDWELTCPDPAPLQTTQQIAAAGIQTYVVGFFGQEAQAGSLGFLNDMACAGQTAKDFANNCVQVGVGYVAKDPNFPTPLYLQAGANELPATLEGIAAEILELCVPQ